MSDTPDFDSMSPDEMMKWMESLAKRQGAAEGFTTDADLEIDEVDENDERLAEVGEYKPYGMSDEDWAAMQEREAAEKAARLAAQQPIPETQAKPEPEIPAPEPIATEPEPVVASADDGLSDGDMPDFDSMTPEETMKWMESLAKRQGAAEGFTTSADLDIAEVDANDERLAGVGEYKPYGMSDEDWAAMQEREAAEKAAKLAAMADTSLDIDDEEDELEYVEDDEDELEYIDDDDDLVYATDDSEEYLPYEFDEDDAFEYEEDDEEYEGDEELVRANLEVLGFDPDDDSELDDEELAVLDFSNIIEEDAPDPVEEASANPMDWLASLGQDNEAPALDLGLDDLATLGESEGEPESENPMDWLASLSGGDNDSSPDLEDFTALVEENEAEGSLEWMESLAKRNDAPEEELVTAADLNIPIPDHLEETGPGYEEFSFEEATGMMQDTDQTDAIQASMSDDDGINMELDDPELWLDQLASGVSERGSVDEEEDSLEDIFAGAMDASDSDINFDDIFAAEASNEIVAEDEPEQEGEEQFDDLAESVKSQIASGMLGDDPEDLDKFFRAAFNKASTRDVPDYIDEEDAAEDEDITEPLQAEIPEWLEQSMAVAEEAEEEPVKTDTAEMMIADLGLEEEIEDTELPDWLAGGMEQDTGDIAEDIFDEMDEVVEEADLNLGDDLDTVPVNVFDITDTQDTWVEAFSQEETGELAAWYDDAVSSLEDNESSVAEVEAEIEELDDIAEAVILQVADLPIESTLSAGTPQAVPDWMSTSDDSDRSMEVAVALDDGGMEWLDEGADDEAAVTEDMPDWLLETVDDSVTEGDELPDWLAGETDISPDEIPDWLRETMDDEEELLDESVFAMETPVFEDTEDDLFDIEPEPEPTPLPVPVAQSPAPVPINVERIDAVAFMRSAKEKTDNGDIEGGMRDYEQVIRANKALPQVEKAVQKLIADSTYKRNPTVNRVMGDVLMRQGKLQEALDIYRKALNML